MTMPDGTRDGWQADRPGPRGAPQSSPALREPDQQALDALAHAMQTGAEPARGHPQHARMEKLKSVFEIASASPALDAAARGRLIELTIARLGAVPQSDQTPVDPSLSSVRVDGQRSGGPSRLADAPPSSMDELIPDDEEALDAWVLAGYRSARVPGSLRARAERLEAIGALLTSAASMGGIERATLARATLARIDAAEPAGTRGALSIENARQSRTRWTDLVSVAAMLALGAAVMWPVVGSARASSQQASCAGALRQAAAALASYADLSRGVLPMATASVAGLPWWEVGTPEHSNSANLFTLVAQKFIPTKTLACAGNGCGARACERAGERDWNCLDDVSYSYRVMFGGQNPTFSDPRLSSPSSSIVLSDASPVVRRAVKNQVIFPTENSSNHGARGQNALRMDGSVEWMPTPITSNGDNIWLPRGLEQALQQIAGRLPPGSSAVVQVRGWSGPSKADPLRGNEIPADPSDAFVGP